MISLISDVLYYIPVPFLKLSNSFKDSNKIKTLNFIGAFSLILKTLLNLQFSIVAVVISTVAFAKCTHGKQIKKITKLEDVTPRTMIRTSQVKSILIQIM